MIRDLKAFYVAILDNEVVCFDTNLLLFTGTLLKMESKARNYDWFYREFKKAPRFTAELSGKQYYFQKVL